MKPGMPLRILSVAVKAEWVDYNGHMGDFAYGIVFSDAATAYMDRLGIDALYRERTAATLYTLESRIGYRRECHENDSLNVDLLVIDADTKRMHLYMRMVDDAGEELALCEQVLMHVSRARGEPCSAALPQKAYSQLTADLASHATIERPNWLERKIGLRRD